MNTAHFKNTPSILTPPLGHLHCECYLGCLSFRLIHIVHAVIISPLYKLSIDIVEADAGGLSAKIRKDESYDDRMRSIKYSCILSDALIIHSACNNK